MMDALLRALQLRSSRDSDNLVVLKNSLLFDFQASKVPPEV